MSDDDQDIIAILERKVEFHSRESDRYRAALAAIRGGVRAEAHKPAATMRRAWDTTPDGRGNNLAMIRQVLAEASEPLALDELTAAMVARGWRTASTLPKNTVRTAAMRLVERGAVVRLHDGRFRAPQPEAGADE